MAVILFIGFAPSVTTLAVDEIAKLILPTAVITIAKPTGLLTGNLTAGTITISDTKGALQQVTDWKSTGAMALSQARLR